MFKMLKRFSLCDNTKTDIEYDFSEKTITFIQGSNKVVYSYKDFGKIYNEINSWKK